MAQFFFSKYFLIFLFLLLSLSLPLLQLFLKEFFFDYMTKNCFQRCGNNIILGDNLTFFFILSLSLSFSSLFFPSHNFFLLSLSCTISYFSFIPYNNSKVSLSPEVHTHVDIRTHIHGDLYHIGIPSFLIISVLCLSNNLSLKFNSTTSLPLILSRNKNILLC